MTASSQIEPAKVTSQLGAHRITRSRRGKEPASVPTKPLKSRAHSQEPQIPSTRPRTRAMETPSARSPSGGSRPLDNEEEERQEGYQEIQQEKRQHQDEEEEEEEEEEEQDLGDNDSDEEFPSNSSGDEASINPALVAAKKFAALQNWLKKQEDLTLKCFGDLIRKQVINAEKDDQLGAEVKRVAAVLRQQIRKREKPDNDTDLNNHAVRFFARLRKPQRPADFAELHKLVASIDEANPLAFIDKLGSFQNIGPNVDREGVTHLRNAFLFTMSLERDSLHHRILTVLLGLVWLQATEDFKDGTGRTAAHWDDDDWRKFYTSLVSPSAQEKPTTQPVKKPKSSKKQRPCLEYELKPSRVPTKAYGKPAKSIIPFWLVYETVQAFRLYGFRIQKLMDGLSPGCILLFLHALDMNQVNKEFTHTTERATTFYTWAQKSGRLDQGKKWDGKMEALGKAFLEGYGISVELF